MRRALAFVLLLGCTATEEQVVTPEQRGEALVDDRGFSDSSFNAFQCTHCHAKVTPPPGRLLPAPPLAGAVKRPTFWNGRFLTLFEAVDYCQQQFMRGAPLDPTSKKALDLYAYLGSIAALGPTTAQPFPVLLEIKDLPRGDAAKGAQVWEAACKSCHGAPHSGTGRLKPPVGDSPVSVVPEETIAFHGADGPDVIRQVVIEKIRHGGFLGFSGRMPPYPTNVLTDAQVADLLTFLGLYDLK